MTKPTKAQARMLARLTDEYQPIHRMGKGFTFATACALEKKGLADVRNCVGEASYWWGVRLKKEIS